MTQDNQPRTWLALGFIIGPYLPSGEIQIDGISIQPLPADVQARLVEQRAWSMDVERLGRGVILDPPSARLVSDWGVVFRVTALTVDDVEEQVREDRVPRLLAALNTLGRYPYRVEVLAITDEETSLEVTHFETGAFGQLSVEPFPRDWMESFYGRWQKVGDERARQIADRLRSATVLEDLHGLVPARLAELAIEEFYLALEGIGRAVAPRIRAARADQLATARETIASALVADLTAAPAAKRPSLIHAAKKELDRLNIEWVSLQVEAAGTQLGLAASSIEDAVALCRLRNRLAHGDGADELGFWLAGPDHRAFDVVSSFVGAYLDALDGA